MAVTKNLYFHMPRLGKVFFHQHIVVTKTIHGFASSRCQGFIEFFGAPDLTHAFATATGNSLQQDRVTHVI